MAEALAVKPVIRRSLGEGMLICPDFEMEQNPQLAFGSAFHWFVQLYTDHLVAQRLERDPDEAQRYARQAWANTLGLDWIAAKRLKEGMTSHLQDFLDLCQLFADNRVADLEKLIAIEKPMQMDVGWAILICTPDRIDRVLEADDEITIIDRKTEQAEMEHWVQILWYTQLAFHEFPHVNRLHFLIDPVRRRQPYPTITFERGQHDGEWATLLLALKERVELGGKRHGGPACEGCALRAHCAESIVQVELEVNNDEDAERANEEWHRLVRAAKAREEALRRYLKDHPRAGWLEIAGEEFGYLTTREPSLRWTIPIQDIPAWAESHGMVGWNFLVAPQPKNRGVVELAVNDGVAEFFEKAPTWKRRKAETARKRIQREADRQGLTMPSEDAAEDAEDPEEIPF